MIADNQNKHLVAVMGAGGVGLNVIQGAVLASATKIVAIDLQNRKLELAGQFGATHTINAADEDPLEKVMEITHGIGVDYAFEVIGKPETIVTTYKMVRRGGNTVLVGLADMEAMVALPIYEIPLMEKNILGCNYGSGDSRLDLITLLELYKAGRIHLEQLITKRYSLEEINQGFDDLAAGKNIRGMIIY